MKIFISIQELIVLFTDSSLHHLPLEFSLMKTLRICRVFRFYIFILLKKTMLLLDEGDVDVMNACKYAHLMAGPRPSH